jgi:hypothetical protein
MEERMQGMQGMQGMKKEEEEDSEEDIKIVIVRAKVTIRGRSASL